MSKKDISKKTTRLIGPANSFSLPNRVLFKIPTIRSMPTKRNRETYYTEVIMVLRNMYYDNLATKNTFYTSASGTALALAQSLI